MSEKKQDVSLDYGLIAPLSIPEDSKIPDPVKKSSTSAEYDLYFRIVRANPDLLEWTKTCLQIQRVQIEDLDRSSLSDQEKYALLKGLSVVYGITLEKWVKI